MTVKYLWYIFQSKDVNNIKKRITFTYNEKLLHENNTRRGDNCHKLLNFM